ncbi:GntR family transcriptional regulator [Lysinimonas soli]|uniref:GntR family transcriptional regulator n=1 Tax=Lysinimonas soli TaxID=1074233 RepID=A0ABW0NQ69_9MICO
MLDMAVTRHPPIRDQIAVVIRNAIVNLDLRPGQLLIERELCEMTGASRPSVREALRQLEAEGLVESQNGRGTIVRTLSAEEAANIYEVRAELEGFAARLFCERADETLQARIADAVQMMERANDGDLDAASILAAQRSFYQALFEGAGNPLLDQLVQGLQVRIAQLRAMTLEVPGRPRDSLEEFQSLARELSARRRGAAQKVATAHVRRAAQAMAQAMTARASG